jgi:hypothetical protein
MALVLADRVKETSTTTGTGTFSLAGAVSGYESFVTGIGNGNTTYYAIVNSSLNEWEVGVGTVTDNTPDTLARTTILASSNSDSAVNFGAGTKDVFCTYPATKSVYKDASGIVAFTAITASTSLTTPIVQATNSGGLALKNSAGTTQLSMGGGGGDNLSINVSTNINGTNAQIDISPTGTGHVHIKPTGSNSVEISPTSVGTINNMAIGGTTPAAGAFTTLSASTAIGVASGGTGASSLTANNVILGNGTSAVQVVAPGTTGNVLTSNGTTWQSTAPAAGGVSTISFGSTGLTPSTATSGAVSVAGTLAVANGGTGATTLAGANIPVVNVANTFTGTQTFSGTSSAIGTVLNNAAEVTTVSATAATGTIAYDITTQAVLYYTSNASANWTVNFRGSSGTSLNTLMSTGQSMTVAFLVTQGATAYYNNVVQVDGTTTGVTTRWLGGAPTAGNASGIDSYRYLIIKTGSATFTVLASNTQFKA